MSGTIRRPQPDPVDDLTTRRVLAELAAAIGGTAPPCWGDPDNWFEGDANKAVAACLNDCHALAECGRYADLVEPSYGVWAGVDRSLDPDAPVRRCAACGASLGRSRGGRPRVRCQPCADAHRLELHRQRRAS